MTKIPLPQLQSEVELGRKARGRKGNQLPWIFINLDIKPTRNFTPFNQTLYQNDFPQNLKII